MKIVTIQHCFQCPNYNKDAVCPYCDKSKRVLVNNYHIPKWCELEEAWQSRL